MVFLMILPLYPSLRYGKGPPPHPRARHKNRNNFDNEKRKKKRLLMNDASSVHQENVVRVLLTGRGDIQWELCCTWHKEVTLLKKKNK